MKQNIKIFDNVFIEEGIIKSEIPEVVVNYAKENVPRNGGCWIEKDNESGAKWTVTRLQYGIGGYLGSRYFDENGVDITV